MCRMKRLLSFLETCTLFKGDCRRARLVLPFGKNLDQTIWLVRPKLWNIRLWPKKGKIVWSYQGRSGRTASTGVDFYLTENNRKGRPVYKYYLEIYSFNILGNDHCWKRNEKVFYNNTKTINRVFISCITDWTQTKLIKAKSYRQTKLIVPYQ